MNQEHPWTATTNASTAEAASGSSPEAAAIATPSTPSAGSKPAMTRKTYVLRPNAPKPLPKKAVATVIEYLRKKAAASAAYAEVREMEAAMMPKSGRRLIKPGVIYQLPEPVRFGDGLIRAFGFVDQFTGKDCVSKAAVINRFEFKKWTHGPKETADSQGGSDE